MTTETLSWIGQSLAAGRYQVTARLGEGGMGFVYRAWDRNLECDVVIKVPRAEMLADPEFAGRFAREIRSLVRLAHPHIVKVFDVGEEAGLPFAVLQFLPGGSLRDGLDPAALSLSQRLQKLHDWLMPVADALDFTHTQGYVHRDVKPENILLDAQGHAFLSDFGITKVLADSRAAAQQTAHTKTGLVLGTPQYMAPELIMGLPYDGRVDQYALAIMVHEMVSGSLPITGPTPAAILVRQTTEPPVPLESASPGIPEALGAAVRKALAKDPAARFSNCMAFAREVLGSTPALPAARPAAPIPVAPETSPHPEATSRAIACPSCGKQFKTLAAAAGRRVRCTACQAVFHVPQTIPMGMPAGALPTAETSRAVQTRAEKTIRTYPRPAPSPEVPPVRRTAPLAGPSRREERRTVAPPPVPSSKAARSVTLRLLLFGLLAVPLLAGISYLWYRALTRHRNSAQPATSQAAAPLAAGDQKPARDNPRPTPAATPDGPGTKPSVPPVSANNLRIQVTHVRASGQQVRVRLHLENASTTSPLPFTLAGNRAGDGPRLIDGQGNTYPWNRAAKQQLLRYTIPPGQSADGELVFARPPGTVESLRLELPAVGNSEQAALRVQIPETLLLFVTACARKTMAVPDLCRALQGGDAESRIDAARALREIGPDAASAVRDLKGSLTVKDAQLREAAALALGAIGASAAEAVPTLLETLRDDDPAVSGAAIEALGALPPPTRADLGALREALNSPNARVLSYVMGVMGQLGPEARRAAPELIRVLEVKTAGPAVRAAAALTLGRIGADDEKAIPALRQAIQDHEALVRQRAVEALVHLSPAQGTTLALIEALAHSDEHVSGSARDKLGKTERPSKEDIQALCNLLKPSNRDGRLNAVSVLAELGPKARGAQPTLLEALKDKDSKVRHQAVVALARGPDAWMASAALAQRLTDTDPAVQKSAVAALTQIGPDAGKAVPDLVRALRSPKASGIEDEIVTALVKIGKAAVPDLAEKLQEAHSNDEDIQTCKILGQIGPVAKDAIPALRALANNKSRFQRVNDAAAEALEKIER
jgi:serine/threonine-protein kinase